MPLSVSLRTEVVVITMPDGQVIHIRRSPNNKDNIIITAPRDMRVSREPLPVEPPKPPLHSRTSVYRKPK